MAGNPQNGKTASREQLTKAKCPKCGRFHVLRLYWTGTTKVPYIYCEACKNTPAFGLDANMAQGR